MSDVSCFRLTQKSDLIHPQKLIHPPLRGVGTSYDLASALKCGRLKAQGTKVECNCGDYARTGS